MRLKNLKGSLLVLIVWVIVMAPIELAIAMLDLGIWVDAFLTGIGAAISALFGGLLAISIYEEKENESR